MMTFPLLFLICTSNMLIYLMMHVCPAIGLPSGWLAGCPIFAWQEVKTSHITGELSSMILLYLLF